MLEKDVEKVNKFLNWGNVDSKIIASWNRIKKELAEIKKPAHNNESAECSCDTYGQKALCTVCGGDIGYWSKIRVQ